MTPRLTPETEEAVRARIAYFRDLGVYDFYRRDSASRTTLIGTETATENAEPAGVATVAVTQPLAAAPAADPETTEEMPRKSAAPVNAEPSASVASIRPQGKAAALQAIREDIGDCRRCALHKGRHTIVFADGDPNARLMFVGEGPGADEDAQGLPFVGRAGQLLNNMISAMGLRRDQVYIANIVKCRPPQNRVPEPVEANTCSPFLFRQIDVIGPEVIVALGSTAATYLLGGKSPLAALRGRIHQARGSKLIVTYHPAYLLRDPRQKKEAWADLQIAMQELGLKAAVKGQ
ncbi:MAG TPA: uracil-DNA glycosylase [Acidobacteriaceae bacterium]|nr:uracil-DNA glycosylase [Acidobacteriaceae bacterium]